MHVKRSALRQDCWTFPFRLVYTQECKNNIITAFMENCYICMGHTVTVEWERIRFSLRKGRVASIPCIKILQDPHYMRQQSGGNSSIQKRMERQQHSIVFHTYSQSLIFNETIEMPNPWEVESDMLYFELITNTTAESRWLLQVKGNKWMTQVL